MNEGGRVLCCSEHTLRGAGVELEWYYCSLVHANIFCPEMFSLWL